MTASNTCEACPLSMLCNSEAEALREELHGIAYSTMETSERYEYSLSEYQEQQLTSPEEDKSAQGIEEMIPGFRNNAANWIDTKLGRIATILTFKEQAQTDCPGPVEKRKYYLFGKRVLKCSAKYDKLHYATFKLISILPRSGPYTG